MKQVVQNYNSGELWIEDVPTPLCKSGGVLVRSAYSLVSIGTERMKVTQARMSKLQMARARPDKVKQVIETVRQTGVIETYKKVRERLDALTPLGYSLAGVVEEVGAGLDEFRVGDRVACAGEKIACHADFVSVPRNLCVHVPDAVDLKDAAFATVGAIAMQGVRQSGVMLGDTVLVVGLGLVGLLGVQILKAAGCQVIGVDLDPKKVELARRCGADLAVTRDNTGLNDDLARFTGGRGPDVGYIAASANTADPMALAGEVVRDRGRVVIVGMVKVEADWQVYYEKELSVVMSRSYGPGRYDPNFEQKGIDYPVGYVPWTQRRNMEEFLRLIGAGHVDPQVMTPQVYDFANAPEAYDRVSGKSGAAAPIAILFEYPPDAPKSLSVTLPATAARRPPTAGQVNVSLVGAGNFATGTLIPALKSIPEARLRTICSARGLSAASAARRHGFAHAASDLQELLTDVDTHAVVIATRHDTHAHFTGDALRAGKHVFVEKPLALTREQLDNVIAAQAQSDRIVLPGFNRRFSPLSEAVQTFFSGRTSPIEVVCRVNAGALGSSSWYQDADEGGWRIISEGCHFVDLIQYLCQSPPVWVSATMIGGAARGQQNDNCAVTLRMADGSLAVLIYIANGDSSFEKERIEVFGQGRVAVIENWHVARLVANGHTEKVRPHGSGKGHGHEMAAFINAIQTGHPSPLPFDQAVATTLATFAAAESLTSGQPVELPALMGT